MPLEGGTPPYQCGESGAEAPTPALWWAWEKPAQASGCWVKPTLREQHCTNTEFLVWGPEALRARSKGQPGLGAPHQGCERLAAAPTSLKVDRPRVIPRRLSMDPANRMLGRGSALWTVWVPLLPSPCSAPSASLALRP